MAITTDASSEVHVLLLDGHTLSVDGTKVGVLEETHDVGLGSLLKGLQSLGREAEIVIHVQGDSAHKTLEGGTGKQHVNGLLIALDLAKGHSTGLESGLFAITLDTTLGRGGFLDGFGGAFNLSGHLARFLGFGSNF